MQGLRNIIIPLTIAVLAALTVTVVAVFGTGEDAASTMIRLSAATSLVLFSLAWTASSLHRLLPGDAWRVVLQARRRIGLAFAASHTVHLAAIAWLVETAFHGDWSQLGDLVGGTVIYVLIYLMAATSNDASVRLLGPRRWKWLHIIGGYAVWVGLTSSYLGRAVEGAGAPYWTLSALCLAAWGLRIAAFQQRRRAA